MAAPFCVRRLTASAPSPAATMARSSRLTPRARSRCWRPTQNGAGSITSRCTGGKGLATSGADTVIIWPFASKDGPMGKEPAMLAPLQARVSMVACHPKQDIMAAGYSDGTVLIVRLEDGAEILVRRNGSEPVSALAWNAKGTLLAFGTEDGDAGILEF